MAKKASAYVIELCEKQFARFTGNEITFHKRFWWRLRSSGNWKILAPSEMLNTKRARDAVALPLAKALGAEVREGKV